MSAREWKPGDVAIVTDGNSEWRGIVRPRKQSIGTDLEVVYVTGGYDMVDDLAEGYEICPLVVIDPEDEQSINRLLDLIDNTDHGIDCGSGSCRAATLAHVLREFANPKPPRPEEPTGLGAVVEDAEGKRWIRSADTDCVTPWQMWCSFDGSDYADIDAVRVLSEGVTA